MGTFLSVLGIFGGRAYQVYYSATMARQQVGTLVCQAIGVQPTCSGDWTWPKTGPLCPRRLRLRRPDSRHQRGRPLLPSPHSVLQSSCMCVGACLRPQHRSTQAGLKQPGLLSHPGLQG